jgi:hypothetical protein
MVVSFSTHTSHGFINGVRNKTKIKYNGGVASSDVMFVANFVKIRQFHSKVTKGTNKHAQLSLTIRKTG